MHPRAAGALVLVAPLLIVFKSIGHWEGAERRKAGPPDEAAVVFAVVFFLVVGAIYLAL